MGAQTISGKIVDSKTKRPIPYVNIGILHKNAGTVCDSCGFFKLNYIKRNTDDTLKISCVGYSSFVLPLYSVNENSFLEHTTFELDPQENELKEIVVRPGKIKTKTLGNKIQNAMIVSGFSTSELGSEVGAVLKYNKKKAGKIKDFNFYLTGNLFDSATFRVNLYEFKDGQIGKQILAEHIYIKTKVKAGRLAVDVEQKDLFISGDCF